MTIVMEPHTMNQYLDEIQRFKVLMVNDPDGLQNLLNYILEQKGSYHSSPENVAFFDGEYAFYNGSYEQALVFYMKARTVPCFEFFCFRVSAQVSLVRGELEKARRFIDKALHIRASDYSALSLSYQILQTLDEKEKLEEMEEKIQLIEEKHLPGALESENPVVKEDVLQERSFTENPKATNEFIATKLGVDLDMENALEARIQDFHKLQTELVQKYLEESKKNQQTKNHALYVLNSWNELTPFQLQKGDRSNSLISQVLLGEQLRRDSGGFFIRWNGQGIVINPGPNFLENFHNQGLHIKDISHVVVTRDAVEAYRDIQRIYDLNYHLNKINPELQVIHYYLNHKAYKDLSHLLKPNFKQERNTVHSLELFLDSPDVEKEELAEGVTLNFFSATSRGGFYGGPNFKETSKKEQSHCLGIRLDLKKEGEAGETVRVGYVSGSAWSPLLAHNLGSCDILITGFGNTNPNDYGKLNYNETTLGYFGTSSLLEEVKPRLFFCTEFDGREGDIRLEVTKKLRKEYEKTNSSSQGVPAILPADNGLFVDLKTLQVECSVSKTLLDAHDVVAVKTNDTFGSLRYLSPTCLL